MPGLLAITNGTDSESPTASSPAQQHNQLAGQSAPAQSVTIPKQSAPSPAASIPPAATSPAALAAGLIDKLKARPGTMIKRQAACQSDLEPAPKKPKTKPPTAPATKPPAGTKPASTSKGAKKAGAPPGNTKNMPLGAFPGVPQKATPKAEYKDFRIYTDMSMLRWRVVRRGKRNEIPLDAHALWENSL